MSGRQIGKEQVTCTRLKIIFESIFGYSSKVVVFVKEEQFKIRDAKNAAPKVFIAKNRYWSVYALREKYLINIGIWTCIQAYICI